MAELLLRNPAGLIRRAGETRTAAALVLESFEAAVTKAAKAGITYDTPIVIDGWEIIFSKARVTGPGLLPVLIKHAVYFP